MNSKHLTKNKYSTNVYRKRKESEMDEKAKRSWEKARREHDKYIGRLESVDIDDYASESYSEDEVNITLRKMIIPSKVDGVDVVADFAGGYMRLQVKGTTTFLGKEWNEVNGPTYREKERRTHFRIKKMEEL